MRILLRLHQIDNPDKERKLTTPILRKESLKRQTRAFLSGVVGSFVRLQRACRLSRSYSRAGRDMRAGWLITNTGCFRGGSCLMCIGSHSHPRGAGLGSAGSAGNRAAVSCANASVITSLLGAGGTGTPDGIPLCTRALVLSAVGVESNCACRPPRIVCNPVQGLFFENKI